MLHNSTVYDTVATKKIAVTLCMYYYAFGSVTQKPSLCSLHFFIVAQLHINIPISGLICKNAEFAKLSLSGSQLSINIFNDGIYM